MSSISSVRATPNPLGEYRKKILGAFAQGIQGRHQALDDVTDGEWQPILRKVSPFTKAQCKVIRFSPKLILAKRGEY